MRTKKRTLLTTKVYGFNPWMDQVTAINDLMDTLGQKSEAPIIRDLIDEALAARRRKSSEVETKSETPSAPAVASLEKPLRLKHGAIAVAGDSTRMDQVRRVG